MPDDDSTVEMPEEYYKAMHRTRVRVPKFIVPTPLLDVLAKRISCCTTRRTGAHQ